MSYYTKAAGKVVGCIIVVMLPVLILLAIDLIQGPSEYEPACLPIYSC